jgi:NADH:ubiquinone oxidoreductase subunit 3 (subunit A)
MMLAESLSISGSSSLPAWLVFVALVVASAAAIPLGAWVLGRRLPPAKRASISLEPVVFGISQKSRRSPRHAVLLHRTLMTMAFVAVLTLFLLPGIVAIRELGVSGLQVAIGLVLPTLLVALHARQRNAAR